jgi:hypothetical protein
MKIAEHGPDFASLQELVDSVPALIHTARPDGSIDFFNLRWLEFVGLRLEESKIRALGINKNRFRDRPSKQ